MNQLSVDVKNHLVITAITILLLYSFSLFFITNIITLIVGLAFDFSFLLLAIGFLRLGYELQEEKGKWKTLSVFLLVASVLDILSIIFNQVFGEKPFWNSEMAYYSRLVTGLLYYLLIVFAFFRFTQLGKAHLTNKLTSVFFRNYLSYGYITSSIVYILIWINEFLKSKFVSSPVWITSVAGYISLLASFLVILGFFNLVNGFLSLGKMEESETDQIEEME